MEFKPLEESKTKLVFELKGETHTFCNLLRDQLLNVKGVMIATYRIDHPLIGIPTFLVETKGLAPRDALREALSAILKMAKEFQKEVSSL